MIKSYPIDSNEAQYTAEELTNISNYIFSSEGVFGVNGGSNTDFKVTATAPASMSVSVNTGGAILDYTKEGVTWKVYVKSNAVETVNIGGNSSGVNRVDAVVIHFKQDTLNALKNNVAEVRVAVGTGIAVLSDGAISALLGDTNWYRLADITVANGAVSVVTGDIADTRTYPSIASINNMTLGGAINSVTANISTVLAVTTITGYGGTDYPILNRRRILNQASLTGNPPAGYVDLYSKNGRMTHKDSAGVEQGYAYVSELGGGTLLTAGETINGGTTPVPVFQNINQAISERAIYSTTIDADGAYKVYGATYVPGQMFAALKTNRITKVDLYIKRVGSPAGNFVVNVHAMGGDGVPGVVNDLEPLAAVLGTASMSALAVSTSYTLYTFTFASPITVIEGNYYCIEVTCLSGDVSNYIYMAVVDTATDYAHVYHYGSASDNTSSSWPNRLDTFQFSLTGNIYGSYVDATTSSRMYMADGNDVTRLQFDGFAVSTATAGNTLIVIGSGMVEGFVGLTPGAPYYIQDAIGTIGVTPGSSAICVGRAVSATQIFIEKAHREFIYKVPVYWDNIAATPISASPFSFKTCWPVGARTAVLIGEFTCSSHSVGYDSAGMVEINRYTGALSGSMRDQWSNSAAAANEILLESVDSGVNITATLVGGSTGADNMFKNYTIYFYN